MACRDPLDAPGPDPRNQSRGDGDAAAERAASAARIFSELGAEEWGQRARRRVDDLIASAG